LLSLSTLERDLSREKIILLFFPPQGGEEQSGTPWRGRQGEANGDEMPLQ